MASRAEVRALFQSKLSAASASSRPSDPLARSDAAGRTSCAVCRCAVADGQWPLHSAGRSHQRLLRALKAQATDAAATPPTHLPSSPPLDSSHRPPPSPSPAVTAAASIASASSSASSVPAPPAPGLPADFFASPAAAPPSAAPPEEPRSQQRPPPPSALGVAAASAVSDEAGGGATPAFTPATATSTVADDGDGVSDEAAESVVQLALALSRSLPPPAVAPPAASSSAPSLGAELAAFESELAEAEAELRGREEEERRRLEGLRRTMERDEAEDAQQRLAQLSGEVAQLRKRRRRDGDAQLPAAQRTTGAKRPTAGRPSAPRPHPLSLLYEQLDEAFGWREAQT